MLDGRVKTLHPNISGGILAMRSNAEHMEAIDRNGIAPIDMVVVNLYEFEKIAARKDASLEELIENIDIGGPTMIRAAAKNYQDVAVIVSPADYPAVLSELKTTGSLSRDTCWKLSLKAWAMTAAYDRAVSARLGGQTIELRYGENPHQKASLQSFGVGGIAGARQLHGKELSYNNLVDLDAAWQLISEFDRPAAAIIKHTNPCGCAEQETLAEAYRKA